MFLRPSVDTAGGRRTLVHAQAGWHQARWIKLRFVCHPRSIRWNRSRGIVCRIPGDVSCPLLITNPIKVAVREGWMDGWRDRWVGIDG